MTTFFRKILRRVWKARKKRWCIISGRSSYGRGASSWEEAVAVAEDELSKLMTSPFVQDRRREPENYEVYIKEPDGYYHTLRAGGVRWYTAGTRDTEILRSPMNNDPGSLQKLSTENTR